MVNWWDRSDARFVRECLDEGRRVKILRRQNRNHLLCALSGLLGGCAWLMMQWDWFSGAGAQSPIADFTFLVIIIATTAGSLHARMNVRLLLGLQALEGKMASSRSQPVDS